MRLGRPVALALALAVANVTGCSNAPTLPLPPPVATSSAPDSRGMALVEGEVTSAAYVLVFNERLESGVITRADRAGFFSVEIEAIAGDVLSIWQEVDGETGERKQTVVPEPEDE